MPTVPIMAEEQGQGAAGREYAVLVPIIARGGEPSVLLTKRPESLRSYSGQVALPGGGREAGDRDLVATALRETEEEVGIAPELVDVVGELPHGETLQGDRVVPFVGRVLGTPMLRLAPAEVERVLYLPVERIERKLFRLRSHWCDRHGREHPIWTFDVDGCEVWGLTARVLYSAFVDIDPSRWL